MKRNINERLDRVFKEAEENIDVSSILKRNDPEEPEVTTDEPDPDKNTGPRSVNVASGDITTDTGAASKPVIGDITAGEVEPVEPELETEITDDDIPKPTDQYPPVPTDEPAAAKEQEPAELTKENVQTSLVDTRRMLESILGNKNDNYARWAELGRKLGVDDERVAKEDPEIKKTWNAYGEAAREIINFLDAIGERTSQIIGGIKSPPEVPPLELPTGPVSEQ